MWRYEAKLRIPHTRYAGTAERSPSLAYRRWVRHLWYARTVRWHARWQTHVKAERTATAYPSWFAADMACISTKEEYGENGPNTSAGYFGLIYPPSGYVSPGPQIAAQYGDSWLDVPLDAQIALSYSLYQHYGFSPWSTAASCGL